MIHQIRHTFSDGKVIILAIDMASDPANLVIYPDNLRETHPKEYKEMLHKIVVPLIVELSKSEHNEELAKTLVKKKDKTDE